MNVARFRRPRTSLIVATVVLLAMTLLVARLRSHGRDFAVDSTREAEAQPAASTPPLPDTVATFRPALKASVAGGITPELLQQIRGVKGVGAAARVLLSTIEVEANGATTEMSVAGVDPDEFRTLTPDATAQARFVWEGLHQSKTFIANEEYEILGGKPILRMEARLPKGHKTLRIGGVATNGLPSLADALMSLEQAEQLELGTPSLLIVGMSKDAEISVLTKDLASLLPKTQFQNMLPPAGRTFYSGTAAQKAIGSFVFTTNADGTIKQNAKWINEHLATEKMPIIGNVRCHKLMLPQLRFVLQEIQDSGLANLLKPAQTGRCYQPRYVDKDPTHQLSKHAWGLAIDLNVYDNPEGSTPKMDPRIVQIFEKWGFQWGGRWTKPDGMHFQLAALLKQ